MFQPVGLVRRLWSSRRIRIIVSAVLIGVFMGVSMLGLPVEDALVGLRTNMRYKVASKELVMVLLDDRTLTELDREDAPRSLDALLLDKLFAAGAKRIAFDRAYNYTEDADEDRALVEALKRHRGKVYMGAMYAEKDHPAGDITMVPAKIFRDHVEIVSLVGYVHPFKLSTSFPYKSETSLGTVPSLSAMFADLEELPDGIFRPDYAIDVKTINRVSYIDVLRGRMPPDLVRGRDVLVAPTAVPFHDYHEMPSQGFVPGADFQAVAALTLKRGRPIDLGWLPAFIPVILLIITGIGRGRSVDRYRLAGLASILIFIPFILDAFAIHVAIIPAAVTAIIASFRARALDQVEAASETHAGSGLPSVQALKSSTTAQAGIVVALKIRNYGAITGSFANPVESLLAAEIVRRIRISDPGVVVYHEGDMYVWVSGLRSFQDAFENLEGLHQIVQNGIRIEGRDIDLSFNSGVDSDADRPVATRVANALQSAEEAVRNDELICHYDSGKHESHWEISLLTALDRAIDNGEVWVAYQPKLDLRSGRIVGAEALIRWTHPERGPIGPDQFIGLAEQHHRIERLTRFVLGDAVRSSAQLIADGHDFSISVNISAQLLRNPDLPRMIFDVLEAENLPPDRLTLEITETDRLDRSSKTMDMMKRLVDSQLHLSIDDFGTGNATIDYLRYLPAAEVKIDRVFVSHMETSRDDLVLVQSIIDMAHSLNRRVVAEGVESEAILARLRAMNCDQVQGYHIGRPMRIADLRAILEGPGRRRIG